MVRRIENLKRKRLFEMIKRASERPLILVEAGTGYGKSVLYEQFMQDEEKKFIVLQLSRMDNVVGRFWKRFQGAVGEVCPELGEALQGMEFPLAVPAFDKYLEVFVRYTGGMNDIYLVLDDYHLLTELDIQQFIERTVTANLHNLTLILFSSQSGLVQSGYLYKDNLVSRLSEEDLSFTKGEVRQYLEFLDIGYNNNLVDRIYEFTEGWTLAVKLVMISLLSGRSITDYKEDILPAVFALTDSLFFSGYDERLKQGLIKMSLLTSFPVSLTSEITGLSKADIEVLVAGNSFIKYDTGPEKLSVHGIFLEFLKNKQAGLDRTEVNRIYFLAGQWARENGNSWEAVSFYSKCSAYEEILLILKAFHIRRVKKERADILLDILEGIPEEFAAVHWEVIYAKAFFNINNYRIEKGKKILGELVKKADGLRDSERVLGETYLLMGIVRFLEAEPDFAEYFCLASELLPQGSKAIDRTFSMIDINNTFLCKSLKKKDIDDMLQAYRRGMPVFAEVTGGCGAGLLEVAQAELAYYQRDFERAEKYIYSARFHAKEYQQTDIMLNAYYLLIRINLAKGREEETLAYIQEVLDFVEDTSYPRKNYPLLDVILGWLYVRTGESDKLATWIMDEEVNNRKFPPVSSGRNQIMRASWLLKVKKNYHEAEAFLNRVEQEFIEKRLNFSLVFIYMMQYRLNVYTKREDEAYIFLEKAYELSEESGLIMIFVEYGSSIRTYFQNYKLHHKEQKQVIPDSWIENISSRAVTYGKYLNAFKFHYGMRHKIQPFVTLTEKEKEVMEGLCKGLSRQEIAVACNISSNTVKFHLKSIYKKLNVGNHAEAAHVYTVLKFKNRC